MGKGWIKLHRKFLDWEWYTDVPTKTLFIHLLLEANHEPQKWKGIDVEKGQCVVGRKELSQKTGLSEQQIRTALDKLKQTGEISAEPTNKFTVITVHNYALYQSSDDDKQPTNNQQVTINQPTDNQQVTTNKNIKNEKNNKNEKKYIYSAEADEVIDYLNMRTSSKYRHIESTRKHIVARLREGFTVQNCKDVIDKKCVEWMGTDFEKYIRPQTLFGAEKFQNYLNAPVKQKKGQTVF